MKAEFLAELIAPAEVIVAPAHSSNYGQYGRKNAPKALVLHTPEEAADDNEVTPRWFQNPDANASTHYYADSDGDLYQMVPDDEGAWAQNVTNSQRMWKGDAGANPPWSDGNHNLNALSIEIEGFAHRFEWTPEQFRTVATWIAYKCDEYGIPMDRTHICGHEELASHKRDPGIGYGTFDIDALIAEAKKLAESATPHKKPPPLGRIEHTMAAWRGRTTTVPVGYRGKERVYTLYVRE